MIRGTLLVLAFGPKGVVNPPAEMVTLFRAHCEEPHAVAQQFRYQTVRGSKELFPAVDALLNHPYLQLDEVLATPSPTGFGEESVLSSAHSGLNWMQFSSFLACWVSAHYPQWEIFGRSWIHCALWMVLQRQYVSPRLLITYPG